VGHRAGLDVKKRRTLLTLPELELDPSVVLPVASRYTDCAIPAPCIQVYNGTTAINQKESVVVKYIVVVSYPLWNDV
jgi:hypothetical protein